VLYARRTAAHPEEVAEPLVLPFTTWGIPTSEIDINCGGLGFLETNPAHCQTAAQTLEAVTTAAMNPLSESILF